MWMLENATEPEDLLLIAENIPFLSRIEAARLVANSPHLPRILQELERTLTPTELTRLAGLTPRAAMIVDGYARMDAGAPTLVFAHAFVHLCLADPVRCWSMASDALKWSMRELWSRGAGGHAQQVEGLCLALTVLGEGPDFQSGSVSSPGYWPYRSDRTLRDLDPSTSLVVANLLKVSDAGLHPSLLFSKESTSDRHLSLVCMEIIELANGARKPLEDRLKYAWDARHRYVLIFEDTPGIELIDCLT